MFSFVSTTSPQPKDDQFTVTENLKMQQQSGNSDIFVLRKTKTNIINNTVGKQFSVDKIIIAALELTYLSHILFIHSKILTKDYL